MECLYKSAEKYNINFNQNIKLDWVIKSINCTFAFMTNSFCLWVNLSKLMLPLF